jgi:acetyl-CoA carboxylase biotin carboxylase subunit
VGVVSGWTVPGDYDPMLGKLIAWGADRAEAVARLTRALDEYWIIGIKTNLALFRRVLRDPDFLAGTIHTRWLDQWLASHESLAAGPPESEEQTVAALAVALWEARSANGAAAAPPAPRMDSRWKVESRADQLDNQPRR